jgi:hypothetical protein
MRPGCVVPDVWDRPEEPDPDDRRGDDDDDEGRWHDPWGVRALDEDDEPEDEGLGTRARLLLTLAALVVVAATAAAGAAGLLVSVSVLAGLAVLVLALRLPGAAPARHRSRPGPSVDNVPYRAFRQVAEQLSWADVSPRHYDVVTRPLLTRLAAARLADRHRVDLWSDPGGARAVLGDDVWTWVDPAREASRDSQPPGIGPETLTRIVDRLESL